MSDSSLYSDYIATRQRVDQLERIESQSAGATHITLIRTATLAIVTAGTIITWEYETRNSGGFTWSGTTITIPSDGYYIVDMTYRMTNLTTLHTWLRVGGNRAKRLATTDASPRSGTSTGTRFFSAGDTLQIDVQPGINTFIAAGTAYGATEENLFLHIVRVA